MARISTTETVTFVLSRGEMAFANVPSQEMPFLRDFARGQERHRFWVERDMLQRQKQLFLLVEAWIATLQGARRDKIAKEVAYARANWERSARKLADSSARRLPKMPDPMETGATPTVDDGEGEPDDNSRPRGRRQPQRDDTDGEEHWDPKWGDPNTELPPPLPQGMVRLPSSPEPADAPRKKGGRRS